MGGGLSIQSNILLKTDFFDSLKGLLCSKSYFVLSSANAFVRMLSALRRFERR